MFRLPPVPAFLKLPGTASAAPEARRHPTMRHRTCRVHGRLITYGVVDGRDPEATARSEDGEGRRAASDDRTVLLVHGWGLAHTSYSRAAEHLARRGFRVLVPDLPGFGGSTDLPFRRVSFEAFARVLRSFLEEVAPETERVHLVGHSFGGAVGVQVAHDYPQVVRSVVLVDSVSGATWQREEEVERLLAERPLWDWGLHLLSEFPFAGFPGSAGTVLRDLSRNVAWHLPSLSIVASLIRRTDMRSQLAQIASSTVPLAVVWASSDRVITRACYEDQCQALGCSGTVVDGNHGWPLSDPSAFGRVIGDFLAGAVSAAPLEQLA